MISYLFAPISSHKGVLFLRHPVVIFPYLVKRRTIFLRHPVDNANQMKVLCKGNLWYQAQLNQS